MKKLLLLVIALLVGGTAYAQENPRWELSADYSFALESVTRNGVEPPFVERWRRQPGL